MFLLFSPLAYLSGILIGFVLRPFVWVFRILLHLIFWILKRLVSTIVDLVLLVVILVIGLSQDMYKRLNTKYPTVDQTMPAAVLILILSTLTWLLTAGPHR